MGRLNSKEYNAIAKLMRGFLDTMELNATHDLPKVQDITKSLKRKDFFNEAIMTEDIGCSIDETKDDTNSDVVIFVHFGDGGIKDKISKTLARISFKPSSTETSTTEIKCFVVIFVRTIEEKNKADLLKPDINELVKLKAKSERGNSKKIKTQFCILHAPMREQSQFTVSINSRICALSYGENDANVKIASNVYIANLYDIVKMYNHIGTELFMHNVRYHIHDALNVETNIQKTLSQCPVEFFNSNNGIAIQIKKLSDLNRRNEKSVTLTYCGEGDFSVINGAQTISSAADYFFKKPSSDTEKAAIDNAQKNAWVLLRIFYPNENGVACNDAEFDRISISLNRQKPINVMDVEYMCDEVAVVNSLYESQKSNPFYFKILKRGQNELGRFQYELADFGRIVTAYFYNDPRKARAGSTQEIVQHPLQGDADTSDFSDSKSIYAPFSEESDHKLTFMKWYKPVNFAAKMGGIYRDVEKDYRSEKSEKDLDDNILSILSNGRYFFIAYIVNTLNNYSNVSNDATGDDIPSFSDFRYDGNLTTSQKAKLQELIREYADLVSKYSLTYFIEQKKDQKILTSNDFKNSSLYSKWCTYASEDKEVLDWNQKVKNTLEAESEL